MNTLRLEQVLNANLNFPESKNLQQRGIADKIEDSCNVIIKENFQNVISARSRRSIEDITVDNCYIDHKTSDESLDFKMPNLISIDRLMKLDKELIYNFVVYNSQTKSIVRIFALNIFELNWNHLKIQNLGAGQLQIANMAEFLESPKTELTKEQWKLRLKQEAIAFYDKLIAKTNARKKKWQNI